MNYQNISILLISSALVACTGGSSFDGGSSDNNAIPGDSSPISTTIEGRNAGEVLCQEGPRITGLVNKSDFTEQFNLICENGNTNTVFVDLVVSAYDGTNEPQVFLLKNTTTPLYVTNMALAFAIKVPLDNPSQFADYRAHDIFASGLATEDSQLFVEVESREAFPGRRSLEAVTLNYDLKVARGAAIYDKRKTEFNTYLLIEDNRDVVVSTEHLLDAETNANYHTTNGLTIGITAGQGESYMIFISDLVVKDRIDPKRMEEALLDINALLPKLLYDHVVNTEL